MDNNNRVGFFQENPGENSITRLAFFMVIVVALYIAVYQAMTTGTIDIVGFTTMAGTASGLKIWQKHLEK